MKKKHDLITEIAKSFSFDFIGLVLLGNEEESDNKDLDLLVVIKDKNSPIDVLLNVYDKLSYFSIQNGVLVNIFPVHYSAFLKPNSMFLKNAQKNKVLYKEELL